jgi:hypothetical protein
MEILTLFKSLGERPTQTVEDLLEMGKKINDINTAVDDLEELVLTASRLFERLRSGGSANRVGARIRAELIATLECIEQLDPGAAAMIRDDPAVAALIR